MSIHPDAPRPAPSTTHAVPPRSAFFRDRPARLEPPPAATINRRPPSSRGPSGLLDNRQNNSRASMFPRFLPRLHLSCLRLCSPHGRRPTADAPRQAIPTTPTRTHARSHVLSPSHRRSLTTQHNARLENQRQTENGARRRSAVRNRLAGSSKSVVRRRLCAGASPASAGPPRCVVDRRAIHYRRPQHHQPGTVRHPPSPNIRRRVTPPTSATVASRKLESIQEKIDATKRGSPRRALCGRRKVEGNRP